MEPAPLSALNQLLYCPHRCFLMHRCGEMEANAHVWRGRRLHRRVDRAETTQAQGVVTERSRPVQCVRLGITGILDVLEIHEDHLHVVEFKHGRAPDQGVWPNDAVQVCAQVLCLEEEGYSNLTAAIFYEQSGQRRPVVIDAALRARTEAACERLVRILRGQELPKPVPGPYCEGCSVREICLPEAVTIPSTMWE